MCVAHAEHAVCAHFSCFISEIERRTMTAVGHSFISRQHFYLHSVEFQCDGERVIFRCDRHTYVAARVLTVCVCTEITDLNISRSRNNARRRGGRQMCVSMNVDNYFVQSTTIPTHIVCIVPLRLCTAVAAVDVTAEREVAGMGNEYFVFHFISSSLFFFVHFYLTETSTI